MYILIDLERAMIEICLLQLTSYVLSIPTFYVNREISLVHKNQFSRSIDGDKRW